jgi:hypothetical protein
MGIFKNMKDVKKDLKEQKRQAKEIYKAHGGMRGALDKYSEMEAALQLEQALLSSGTPGRATIQSFTDTGMRQNWQPLVAVDLHVTVPGQAPYTAQATSIVPQIYLGRLQTGAEVGVRVDPSDSSKLAIDWTA